MGKGVVIYPPTMILNPQFLHLGDRVTIREGARIEAVLLDRQKPPMISLEKNVMIEQNAHIVSLGTIIMRESSGLAPRCTLNCGTHPFLDVNDSVPIRERHGGVGAFIEIGAQSVLGVNSVVQMNVKIGKYVMVGSNVVIKKSIPDYSVVDGSPAQIVMHYDHEKARWIPVKVER